MKYLSIVLAVLVASILLSACSEDPIGYEPIMNQEKESWVDNTDSWIEVVFDDPNDFDKAKLNEIALKIGAKAKYENNSKKVKFIIPTVHFEEFSKLTEKDDLFAPEWHDESKNYTK